MELKRRILFLCTGNCIRSQMAEGLLRHAAAERFEAHSAGVFPAGFVHELAITVLREIGIDISGQHSKGMDRFLPPPGELPDVLVSLCGYAAQHCPELPPQVTRLHWPVDDPIEARGTLEERLRMFRRVRDELRDRMGRALLAGELDK